MICEIPEAINRPGIEVSKTFFRRSLLGHQVQNKELVIKALLINHVDKISQKSTKSLN